MRHVLGVDERARLAWGQNVRFGSVLGFHLIPFGLGI